MRSGLATYNYEINILCDEDIVKGSVLTAELFIFCFIVGCVSIRMKYLI